MSKKGRPQAQPSPAVRLSGLRPKLDQLFAAPPEAPALAAELAQLTDGLKPASFLPVILGALAATPDAAREELAGPVGAWVRGPERLAALQDLDSRQTFEGPARELVHAWLEAGGLTPADAVQVDLADLVAEAYEIGDESQAAVTLFWYTDARRRKLYAVSFLIDFEPPWEGALKDLAYLPFRDLARAREEFFASWRGQGIQHQPISVAAAMGKVWTTLRRSQAEGIRLPADFIAVTGQLVPRLLALPTVPEVPPLSLEELKELAVKGRIPEALRREEQRSGFQKRMPDGSIIRIMPMPDGDW